MGNRVVLIKGGSQYGVLRDFIDHLGMGFEENGVTAECIDLSADSWFKDVAKLVEKSRPDFVISFNAMQFKIGDKPFYDQLQIPFIGFLVDHPTYLSDRCSPSPYMITLCIDATHADFAQKYLGINNSFFMPHGANQELVLQPQSDKDIDLLFAGTIVNPVTIRQNWKNRFGQNARILRIIEETVEFGCDYPGVPIHSIIEKVLDANNFPLEFPLLVKLHNLVIPEIEKYLRNVWRIKVLSSIKRFNLTIVGNGPWRELVTGPNVNCIPACSFNEANNLMKRSKIVLNIIPMFPAGAHERIFSGMLAHSLVATDKNIFLSQEFTDMKDILFYDVADLGSLEEKINTVLNDKELYWAIVKAGREKVIGAHTWAHRAQQILRLFNA